MSKTLVFIKICPTLIGYGWESYKVMKKAQYFFTTTDHPGTQDWKGLKNALDIITKKDGDFQGTSLIAWGYMVIRWTEGKRIIDVEVDIPRCKLTEEYFTDELENIRNLETEED